MAVAITSTANQAQDSAAGAVATYNNAGAGVSIGTAAADRVIVLCVGCEQTTCPINSVTIDYGSGDKAMAAGVNAGQIGGIYARIFWLPVPTGTTATFKVTYGANPVSGQNWIAVYALTGSGTNPTSNRAMGDTDADPISTNDQVINPTIPSGGGCIAICADATDTTARTWTGITEDLDLDAGTFRFSTGTSTTAGTPTITVSGGNGEDAALAWVVFGGPATSFGDFIGNSAYQNSSITNPFKPDGGVVVSVGDLIVVWVAETAGNTSTACSDNLGNSYSALTGITNGVNPGMKGFYSIATTAGVCVPSITATASGNDACVCTAVYKGPFAASPLDKNPTGLLDSAEPYTAPATGTLSQAVELIVGCFASDNSANVFDTPAPSARFDVQSNVNSPVACITSLVVSSTNSVSMAASDGSGTSDCGCCVATFKQGSTGPATSRPFKRPTPRFLRQAWGFLLPAPLLLPL